MLRIIDANLDRIGEGLRLLEDVARFLLNDGDLSQQLKTMRHELLRGDWPFHQQLIQSRDSGSDVGINIKVPGEEKQRELPVTVMANARRVQESLRVMEEVAKIPDTRPELDPEKFKQARFALYAIEQNLLSKIQRRDKTKHISGLYVVIDSAALKGRNPVEVAGQVIQGGAKAIQLRDKLSSKRELLPTARQLKELCAEHNVLFIMDGYLDLALAANADGLHLDQDDLPIEVVRKLLPIDKIVGVSAHTVEEAVAAESDGADYITVSTIYPTSAGEGEKAVGLDQLPQIRKAVTLPLVAIGGITLDNVADVIAAGADSAAVISPVLETEDIEKTTRQIVERLYTPK